MNNEPRSKLSVSYKEKKERVAFNFFVSSCSIVF